MARREIYRVEVDSDTNLLITTVEGKEYKSLAVLTGEPEPEEPDPDPIPDPEPEPTPEPEPEPEPEPTPIPQPGGDGDGVVISRAELMALPTTGKAWDAVVASAKSNDGSGINIGDQNSSEDVSLFALALMAVRTQDNVLIAKARGVLEKSIGSEEGARWLGIGRNGMAVALAADVLGIRSGPVYEWLKKLATRTLKHNNNDSQVTLRQNAWGSGSNASAQEGGVHAALNAYLGNRSELDWNFLAFRRYAGDRTSSHTISSNSDSWQEKPSDPVGIQNKGAVKNGINIDGAISNDMSRGGELKDPPGMTQYPWVGMNGAVLAALILHRQGYPAFEVEDKALLRAATYLKNLGSSWYDADSRADVKYIINKVYSVNYPVQSPVGASGLVGFSDFWFANGI